MGVTDKELKADEDTRTSMEQMIDNGGETEDEDLDIEAFLREDEPVEKEEPKKPEPEVVPEVKKPEPKQQKIPDEAVEMFVDIQERLQKLAPDKANEASELAGSIALNVSKQFEKIMGEVRSLKQETFLQTEAGQFYMKAKEAFPNLSIEDAIHGYQKYKGLQLESSYAKKKNEKPALDKDARVIAKEWGLKENEFVSEIKRYNKLMSSGDAKLIRKAGEIEI